nr:TPA: gp94-like protein [Oryctes rhinoceros nudivirus]
MKVAEPVLHICVLKESSPTTNFLTPPSSWPILYSHSTTTYKIATVGYRPDIPNVSEYSVLTGFTVWEVDYIPERIINFETHNIYSDQFWTITIASIIELIRKYKIVYFENFPFEYFGIFEKINNEYRKKLGS